VKRYKIEKTAMNYTLIGEKAKRIMAFDKMFSNAGKGMSRDKGNFLILFPWQI
jgi:hypothetical protein